MQSALSVWALLRVFTVVWVAFVARDVPATPREERIAPWPPSTPIWAWLERVLLAPWERWDTVYYVQIVERGYRIDDGTAQFHPLFPWIAMPLAALGVSPLLALMLVSTAASAAMVVAFVRLAHLDLPAKLARWSAVLLLFSPLAFALWLPYTEPLFLLCAVLCLLWARRGWWWRAGLAGAFAVLARQQGVFLLVPLAVELWAATGGHWRGALRAWRHWLSLALIPVGLFVWLVYRAVALGDFQPDWSDPQRMIYSVLISPSATEVVPQQAFLPPWEALRLALAKFWRAPELSLGVDLLLGGLFMVLLVIAWPKMRWSYRLYALVIVCVSFGYHTGPFYPYMGLPRHLLLAFPVFIGLGAQVRSVRSRAALIATGVLGILFTLLLYVARGWTP